MWVELEVCFSDILKKFWFYFNKVFKFWYIWSEVINSLNVCLSHFAETQEIQKFLRRKNIQWRYFVYQNVEDYFFLSFLSLKSILTDLLSHTPPQPALAILLLVEKNNHTKF